MRDLAGDANFVDPAALIGDKTRARILLALLDKRALPMSMLASEAGVALSTMSGHLGRLVDGGMLSVQTQGRHRYYSLASPEVARAMESLARLAPPFEPKSLRSGTRARSLRIARTCYDHLAGHLGVGVMRALIEREAVVGGDGRHDPNRAIRDKLSSRGKDLEYRITPRGWDMLAEIGVTAPQSRRPAVRYCVDWTEQCHHLSGAVGAAVLDACVDRGWLERSPNSRALRILPAGEEGLRSWLGLDTRSFTRA
ncbi:ArsR/SmtB family transcription factor [Streptomyces ochraceiscleroticus]|uniref:ArsR/SmtB family transcription factor n=1 Tax=Streptomyces ochraceiscleroticus TaxID=47761 RepID=A0ABW1MRD0_9ACTN|nr:winged helix-turn-helix domain-containing protein [Streptomyces ochraceiscleroticus]